MFNYYFIILLLIIINHNFILLFCNPIVAPKKPLLLLFVLDAYISAQNISKNIFQSSLVTTLSRHILSRQVNNINGYM